MKIQEKEFTSSPSKIQNKNENANKTPSKVLELDQGMLKTLVL